MYCTCTSTPKEILFRMWMDMLIPQKNPFSEKSQPPVSVMPPVSPFLSCAPDYGGEKQLEVFTITLIEERKIEEEKTPSHFFPIRQKSVTTQHRALISNQLMTSSLLSVMYTIPRPLVDDVNHRCFAPW